MTLRLLLLIVLYLALLVLTGCGVQAGTRAPVAPGLGDRVLYVAGPTGETCTATVNLGFLHEDGRADSAAAVPLSPDGPRRGHWHWPEGRR